MRPRSIIVAAVAITAIALGTWTSYRIMSPPPVPRAATVLPAAGELPEFSLLDHDGDQVGPEVFAGQWDLVFFGFTHCPDVCPLAMQLLASARQQLSEAGFEPLPRIVLVSVDPERDSPEVIRDYVRHFGETNLGITGELEEIRKLTKSLGVYFQKIESDSEYYTVDHYPGVLVMNPAGQLNAIFGTPLEIANLVHDLPIIIENAEKTMPAAALVASGIEVAKPTPQSKMAAGYLSLRNTSDEPVTITRVTSPEYGLVEMHETITEGGVSRMRPIDEVTIPPGRIFYFKRGGKHLMLMQPDGAPSSVTLKFHTGESVVLTVSVPLRD